MSLLRNFYAALQSTIEQKRRASLSALGIMVATVAIVLLVSIARGVQKDVKHEVDDLGVNVLVVLPGKISDDSMFSPNLMGISYLKDADIVNVQKVPGVLTAAPLMFAGGGIRNGDSLSPTTLVIGAGSEWFKIHPVQMAEGRTYSTEDDLASVVVIGGIAKKNLFGEQGSALGKQVDINGHKFTVIGVTKNKSAEGSLFSAGSFENVAYYPYGLAKKISPTPMLHRIMIQTRPDIEPKKLVKQVEAALTKRLDPQLFSVITQEDLLKLVFKIMGILTWLLTGLTSIALFVGGVGIMTVMLMSVSERAKEIGIRKTVGARRSDIFLQFFIEAIFLTFLGGMAGFVLSYIVCLWLTAATPIKPEVSWSVVELAFGTSFGVGSIFGILPAIRAAGQDPITSLRNE